ncbi:MAG: hypothetical protein IBJ03_02795 [Gemmatimonadaceae bacterium]|nr:hypothetical protein [Gemmatimonadaceae bacterium]
MFPIIPQSFAAVRFTALFGVAVMTLSPRDASAQSTSRNGTFNMEWSPEANDGSIRLSGAAKGNLRVESRGDSARVRLELTQRPDGQPESTVHDLVGSWQGDTLTFVQPLSPQVQAGGQSTSMSGHSAWRIVVNGDAVTGTMQMQLDQMNIAIPRMLITGKRATP